MDIPGYGGVEGEWDLRKGVKEYLGNVDFKGKRVLEIGTASGFLCFYMEGQGAEVVAYDLQRNKPGTSCLSLDMITNSFLWTSKPISRRSTMPIGYAIEPTTPVQEWSTVLFTQFLKKLEWWISQYLVVFYFMFETHSWLLRKH